MVNLARLFTFIRGLSEGQKCNQNLTKYKENPVKDEISQYQNVLLTPFMTFFGGLLRLLFL